MKFDLAVAIDSLKQKSWWIWLLILIPFSYYNMDVSNKTVTAISFILGFASILLYPAFVGFTVDYAKKFAHKCLANDEKTDFKKFYILGLKYLIFFILFSITIGLALAILIFVGVLIAVGAFLIPALPLVFKILFGLIGASIATVIVLVYCGYLVVAVAVFIESQDILSVFKVKNTYLLFKNNQAAFYKLLMWSGFVSILAFICNVLIVLMSFISTMFLAIGTAAISYATVMISMNFYGQIINYLKIQMDDLELA